MFDPASAGVVVLSIASLPFAFLAAYRYMGGLYRRL